MMRVSVAQWTRRLLAERADPGSILVDAGRCWSMLCDAVRFFRFDLMLTDGTFAAANIILLASGIADRANSHSSAERSAATATASQWKAPVAQHSAQISVAAINVTVFATAR